MNDEERDSLLIRLDERVHSIGEKVDKFDRIEQIVEKMITDIKWMKSIGASVVGIGSTIAGIVAYFKH